MKIDLENLKIMKEVFAPPQQMGQVVPVTPQRDSFSLFTGGLRENWPFVMAVVGVALWLINGSNAQQSVNDFQDAQIVQNTEDIKVNALNIEQLDQNIQTLNTSHLNSYNELIRKIDGLQTAIDALKSAP